VANVTAARIRRVSFQLFCLLAVLVSLSLVATVAADATQQTLWLDNQYWQTGRFGAESFAHEDPATAGYLLDHVVVNGDDGAGAYASNYKLTKSGQYCSIKGIGPTLQTEETAWFGVPTPYAEHQMGNAYDSVCAAWEPESEAVNWGLQLNDNPRGIGGSEFRCEEIHPSERCGIELYFSLGGQGLNDRPWASYYGSPELVLDDVYDRLQMQAFQAGEVGAGWGYLCPVLEETGKEHDIIEVCFEQWHGYGPKNAEREWKYEHVQECHGALSEFKHTYDRIAVPYNTATLWNELDDEPHTQEEFPIELYGLGHSLQVSMAGSLMGEIAELDDKAYKAKEGARGAELGYGCGRSSSTVPSEWALIGVGNGMEQWETGEPQAGRLESGFAKETLESIEARTEFTPHKLEVVAQKVTKPSETEMTVTGEVNPYGFPTSYVVEYGTAAVGEHVTAEVPVGSGIGSVSLSTTLTGLTASTTYKYRIKATHTSVGGSGYGPEEAFSTLGKPSVETQAATSVRETSATLNGVVNPRGTETKYYFEYGEKGKYEHQTGEASVGAGTTGLEVSQAVTGLVDGHEYDFRIVATNAKGTSDGREMTYKTAVPTWTVESTGRPGSGTGIASFRGVACPALTECVAVGSYNESVEGGTNPALFAQYWNGSEWTRQSPPDPVKTANGAWSQLEGVSCSSATACTAVGSYLKESSVYPLVERWNGTEWAIQTTPSTGTKTASLGAVSCSSASACMAVGSEIVGSEPAVTLAEQWNGVEWKIVSTANPEGATEKTLTGVSCTAATACTAVGRYKNSAGAERTLSESWNGTKWTLQTTLNPEESKRQSRLESVSCATASACTAVGFDDIWHPKEGEGNESKTLAERWNGSEWAIQSMPNREGAYASGLMGVSCMSSTACTAVGYSTVAYRHRFNTLAESWNGTEWKVQTTPSGEGEFLRGVSCLAATCTAVGSRELDTPLAERYE
jgi:hypothetical protein